MRYLKGHAYELTIKATGLRNTYKNLKSIYEHHSFQEIGCKVEWLWKNKISEEKPFENDKVKICLIKIL